MKTKTMNVIDNKLYMGSFMLEEVAKKYGTPLYVYDEVHIKDKIDKYKKSFISNKLNCQVVYASKAFICPHLCNILKERNIFIDAISIGDLYLLKKSNYPMSMVVLHGNNKSIEELTFSVTENVGYIVVDNLQELKKLEKIATEMHKTVKTLFRINPGIEGHTHAFVETSLLDSKFGESIFDKPLLDEIFTIYKNSKYLVLDGFHSHIGSSITSVDVYLALAKKLISFMEEVKDQYGFNFKTLNLGGGFGIKYLDSDPEVDIEGFLPVLVKEVEERLAKSNLEIENVLIEPGRSIVGDAGITLYTCGGVKKTYAGVEYLFIDGGMADNPRFALYGAKYTFANASRYVDQETIYNIAGKCCESGDIIAKQVSLPKAKIGDTIVTYCTGAYCFTMSMNYNGLSRPGVVFIDNDRIKEVVRKESKEDLIKNYIMEKDIKIFDTHSDMLYDLDRKQKRGIEHQFENFHVKQLKNSVITGGIWTMYSPDEFDLIEGLKNALRQIHMEYLPGFKVILGLEGLRNLKKVEDIDIIYNMGFRHAMVTWNEANDYATGAKSDPQRGITLKGKQLYKRMQELGMIIDLAHLNEKSFYEALEIVDKNIIYSHGLCKALCDHPRNLTDDQMRALKKVDGLFGLTLANNFVSNDEEKQDLEHFLDHVIHAKEIMGIDNLCFGFDFMDYQPEFPNSNIKEVPDATKAYRIIDGLRSRGFSEEEIEKICYSNFVKRYKDKIMLGK